MGWMKEKVGRFVFVGLSFLGLKALLDNEPTGNASIDGILSFLLYLLANQKGEKKS